MSSSRRIRRLAPSCSSAERHHDPILLKAVREGVDRPRLMLGDLLRRAQRRGDLAHRLEPEADRVLIAMFQGIVLQQTWDEGIDISSGVGVIQWLLPRR
jgi:hypothetical protein